ncbi:MAG: type II secretion system secretin GspD [gamma proteobacterium symbiont of Taylorina sp.]|nr:type II secretion system secretin GspD [gamma proteobacterium symbiont of Taylorina sp.]
MKLNILFMVLFLAACQTISEKSETEPEVVQKTAQESVVVTQTDDVSATSSIKTPIKPAAPKTDYSQSHQPMSEETKQRLRSNAQELMSNGTIPAMTYQQPTAPVVPATAAEQNPEGQTNTKNAPVQLDYEQVEIRQILEEFSDALNITVVINPAVSGKITMRTAPDSNLTQADLWPILQMLLNEAGVILEKRNGIYYAEKGTNFLPSVIGTNELLATTDASMVMQVTPLKHISLNSATTVLKSILGSKGKMVPVPNLNTLLIIEQPERLRRLNGLLSLIDSDPFKNRGIRLYKIKEAEAKNVAKDLQGILKLIEGNKPVYQVMGLERINALLVVAPPGRGFTEVSRWVDILDAGADEELVEQIFIYKCKSMNAGSLAGTLNAIFQQDDKSPRKQDQDQEGIGNPNEFKSVSKESLSFKSAITREVNKKKGVKPTTRAAVAKVKRNSTDEVSSANINVTIVADEETNSLLVRTTARDYKQLLETIRTLDVVPLQVLINVVIAQVTLSDSQSFGIDWAYLGSSGTVLQTNFGQAQSVGPDGDPLGLIVNRLTGNWRVTLNALAQDSDVNILSRPSLLITNNQEGVINVGKEVPVETSNTTNTNSTDVIGGTNVTQQIAYRKTGIELTVTPHINEDGIVDMSIKQGLSAIEGQTSGSDAGLNPTFTNQEINTSVVVRDGETIILGGLIESVEAAGESGVPVLKDVPLMGNLFKSQGTQVERRELILIISTKVLNIEEDHDTFNEEFKGRYRAAAKYLDKELANKH